MAEKSIIESARKIAERVGRSEGVEIVEVEWKGNDHSGVLRIYIDTPEGVTHGHCERVSRQMSTILDVEDVVAAERYQLEVSSPGLDRKLVKLEDFERFAGKKARLKLEREHAGKRQLTARLGGVDDEQIVLDSDGAPQIRVPFSDVRSARLVVEL